jgi:uncharacterized protein (UPF0332 family)
MALNEHKDTFIKINIEKSDEALRIAELSISENAIMSALNRIYYSVFYTVTALAVKHDFITAKHTQMMGWFNKKFIHEEKIFDKELSKIYRNIFLLRQKGDYDTEYPANIDQAKELLADAKVFIEAVRKVIFEN